MFNADRVAISRTLLFSYGQGMLTPTQIYSRMCMFLRVVPQDTRFYPKQTADVFRKEAKFSFFTGLPASEFCLVDLDELQAVEVWVAQPVGMRLNWIQNYERAIDLISNFSYEDQSEIAQEINSLAFHKTNDVSYLRYLVAPSQDDN